MLVIPLYTLYEWLCVVWYWKRRPGREWRPISWTQKESGPKCRRRSTVKLTGSRARNKAIPLDRYCQTMCRNGKKIYKVFRWTGQLQAILGQRPFLGMTVFTQEWQFPWLASPVDWLAPTFNSTPVQLTQRWPSNVSVFTEHCDVAHLLTGLS